MKRALGSGLVDYPWWYEEEDCATSGLDEKLVSEVVGVGLCGKRAFADLTLEACGAGGDFLL